MLTTTSVSVSYENEIWCVLNIPHEDAVKKHDEWLGMIIGTDHAVESARE